MNREGQQATVHQAAKSQTWLKRLSVLACRYSPRSVRDSPARGLSEVLTLGEREERDGKRDRQRWREIKAKTERERERDLRNRPAGQELFVGILINASGELIPSTCAGWGGSEGQREWVALYMTLPDVAE